MSFHHYDLFRQVFAIFRMGTLLNGLDVREREEREHSYLEPLWGFGYPAIRELVDECHRTLAEGLAAGRPDATLAEEVRDLVARHDHHGFLQSGVNRPRRTGIYLFYFPAMLRWAHRVGSERGKSSWVSHISRLAMRSTMRRRANPGHWSAPTGTDLLRMAARQVRTTLERSPGGGGRR